MKKKSHLAAFRLKHPVLFWAGAVFAGLALLLASFYIYIAWLLPLPDTLTQTSGLPTTKIYDRNGILLYEVLRPESGKVSLVPLDKIPQRFIQATLAAEDINFYSHPGVDLGAIARALFFNLKEQRIVSGGSTITQQLIRNMLGSHANRDLSDKALEAIYAVRISNVYSKDKILELYLNRIYYGNLSYGAQSAALDYFGKNIGDLDLAECSFLAGLPQSPSSYNPFEYFDRAKGRQKYVLDQMVKNDFISAGEAAAALEEPLTLRANKYRMKAPHFVQEVMSQVEDKYGGDALMNGGLAVTTTLDYNLQLKAEELIRTQVEKLNRNHVTSGALVALDVRTGQVLSWVGSADYFDPAIDGAVDMVTSLRQPGSSIKPLTYLLAFEKGYTPATIINDIPTQFSTDTGPYSPKNYDLQYHGPVRARTALASSFNIPAVKTLDFVGIDDFIAFLRKAGIDTLDQPPGHYGLALTLGGGEVRPIDMADAFDMIANYGVKKPSSTILEIKDAAGGELFKWSQPQGEYVLGQAGRQHAYQIISIISDPLARIPGFGEGSVLELGRPAAVKTGTTRNFRDNWTIGFTPQLLTAVWVGNADATPMENVSGVDGAAPVWASFMDYALQNMPKLDFTRPPGLTDVEICALSGKLPTDLCRERMTEIFVKGTEPTEHDDYYKKYDINTADGRIVPAECSSDYPASQIRQEVLIDYPAALQKWAEGERLALPPFETCAASSGYAPGYPGDYPGGQADAFSIDNPMNNDEYLLESTLPLKDQRVPFRVTVPQDTIKVTYSVDGSAVATTNEAPYTYLWMPVKGIHLLKAEVVTANGNNYEKSVSFIVK